MGNDGEVIGLSAARWYSPGMPATAQPLPALLGRNETGAPDAGRAEGNRDAAATPAMAERLQGW
ncbi:hypothetical protein GCM10022406_29570 [Hymenobacter algoricola]|uniref:Uncharacterized protein n=1 Tax=Hymenobacter algoricola TaxID=486267 RepID=A0ABP7NFT3_9BACT